jgi:two-component system, NarL family, sensor histidine kinase UhpB
VRHLAGRSRSHCPANCPRVLRKALIPRAREAVAQRDWGLPPIPLPGPALNTVTTVLARSERWTDGHRSGPRPSAHGVDWAVHAVRSAPRELGWFGALAGGRQAQSKAGNGGGGSTGPSARRPRYLPLLHRVAGINALLLLAVVGLTIAVVVPGGESSLKVEQEGVVLVVALALVVVLNLLLLRRVVRPLQQLTALARTVDLNDPHRDIPDAAPTSEAGELALTFNEMLARLRAERREATGRVLAGQEAERLRIAQELHDQVGQELTGVLLLLSRVRSRAPEELRAPLLDAQHGVRTSLEDVRRIAIELRPEALDDLGLASALAVLCERFTERADLEVACRIAEPLPELSADTALVIYRVAQEALTNVARHARTDRAELTLETQDAGIVLVVRDFGTGFRGEQVLGSGIRGMRERAGLIDATLRMDNAPGAGVEVRLTVPVEVGQ